MVDRKDHVVMVNNTVTYGPETRAQCEGWVQNMGGKIMYAWNNKEGHK